MRRTVAVVAALLTLMIEPVRVTAQTSEPVCLWDGVKQRFICRGDLDRTTAGSGGSGTAPRWPPEGWVPYRLVETGPDGQQCWRSTYRQGGTPAPEDINPYDGGTRDPSESYPPCPGQAGEATDPTIVAASYWEAFPVPRPRPHIAPGWAITGLRAFLETNGQLTFEHSADTPIGGLVIRATARYYVDWGDGERTGPYSFEGRPWPDGRIVHEYIWTGEKDVVLTARWDATWQLAGRSGDLRDRDITARIDDFPVRELQAVVTFGR